MSIAQTNLALWHGVGYFVPFICIAVILTLNALVLSGCTSNNPGLSDMGILSLTELGRNESANVDTLYTAHVGYFGICVGEAATSAVAGSSSQFCLSTFNLGPNEVVDKFKRESYLAASATIHAPLLQISSNLQSKAVSAPLTMIASISMLLAIFCYVMWCIQKNDAPEPGFEQLDSDGSPRLRGRKSRAAAIFFVWLAFCLSLAGAVSLTISSRTLSYLFSETTPIGFSFQATSSTVAILWTVFGVTTFVSLSGTLKLLTPPPLIQYAQYDDSENDYYSNSYDDYGVGSYDDGFEPGYGQTPYNQPQQPMMQQQPPMMQTPFNQPMMGQPMMQQPQFGMPQYGMQQPLYQPYM